MNFAQIVQGEIRAEKGQNEFVAFGFKDDAILKTVYRLGQLHSNLEKLHEMLEPDFQAPTAKEARQQNSAISHERAELQRQLSEAGVLEYEPIDLLHDLPIPIGEPEQGEVVEEGNQG